MSSEAKHTPGPWKAVIAPNFGNGYIYTSIQPTTVDPDNMAHLAMANGEYHVCRMTHTAALHKAELHRANAEFIVRACNAHDEMLAALKAANDKLRSVLFGGDDHPLVAASDAAIAKAEGQP